MSAKKINKNAINLVLGVITLISVFVILSSLNVAQTNSDTVQNMLSGKTHKKRLALQAHEQFMRNKQSALEQVNDKFDKYADLDKSVKRTNDEIVKTHWRVVNAYTTGADHKVDTVDFSKPADTTPKDSTGQAADAGSTKYQMSPEANADAANQAAEYAAGQAKLAEQNRQADTNPGQMTEMDRQAGEAQAKAAAEATERYKAEHGE